jgi:hypothetical protein
LLLFEFGELLLLFDGDSLLGVAVVLLSSCCNSFAEFVADILIGVVCLRRFFDMSGVESNKFRPPAFIDDVDSDVVVDGEETSIDLFGALCCELCELFVCDELEVSLNTDVSSPFKSGGGVAYILAAIILCN